MDRIDPEERLAPDLDPAANQPLSGIGQKSPQA
jgi:hypothetical protein